MKLNLALAATLALTTKTNVSVVLADVASDVEEILETEQALLEEDLELLKDLNLGDATATAATAAVSSAVASSEEGSTITIDYDDEEDEEDAGTAVLLTALSGTTSNNVDATTAAAVDANPEPVALAAETVTEDATTTITESTQHLSQHQIHKMEKRAKSFKGTTTEDESESEESNSDAYVTYEEEEEALARFGKAYKDPSSHEQSMSHPTMAAAKASKTSKTHTHAPAGTEEHSMSHPAAKSFKSSKGSKVAKRAKVTQQEDHSIPMTSTMHAKSYKNNVSMDSTAGTPARTGGKSHKGATTETLTATTVSSESITETTTEPDVVEFTEAPPSEEEGSEEEEEETEEEETTTPGETTTPDETTTGRTGAMIRTPDMKPLSGTDASGLSKENKFHQEVSDVLLGEKHHSNSGSKPTHKKENVESMNMLGAKGDKSGVMNGAEMADVTSGGGASRMIGTFVGGCLMVSAAAAAYVMMV